MARTGAKIGMKTLFEREHPFGSGTYVAVAEVKTIGGPSMSRDALEATHMSSDDDHAEYISGVPDGGEVSLLLNFRPDAASQGEASGLLNDLQAGTFRNWRVRWPQFTNTPTLTFGGIVTGYEPSSATRDVLSVAVKVKVSGKPVATNFA